MSVLFLSPVGSLGGAEWSLLDVLASLRAARPALRLGVIAGADGPLVDAATRAGAEVQVVSLPTSLSRAGEAGVAGARGVLARTPKLARAGGAALGYAADLRNAVHRFAPRVVHSNGIKMHLLGAALPRGESKLVWHLRDYVGPRPITSRALRLLARRPDGLVAISRSVARDASRALGRDDVAVVYNAIDVERFDPAAGDALDVDSLAGLPPAPAGTVRVGLVATYARWKGHEVFLDAAACLRDRAARFYIVGGPTYSTPESQFSSDELAAGIRDRGLGACAGLVPFQSRADRAYRAFDVVVHASTRPEPFGRSIVEAMASARSVVVADEGGAAELFEHDVDAVGVRPRDPAALASALAQLIDDPSRRARLAFAARRTAIERFARPRLATDLLALYERLGVAF